MQRPASELLFSASDLVAFLECEHRTALDLLALDDRELAAQRTQPDESALLVASKGDLHERKHLESLKQAGRAVIDIAEGGGSLDDRISRTLEAMRSGAEVIFQAALRDGSWIGHADFLHRVDGQSRFGNWSYEVADTKLARSAKAKFMVQLAYYSWLVARAQGCEPARMHVVLGTGKQQAFRVADYTHYLASVQERFLQATGALASGSREIPYPVPCDHCSLCHWEKRCEDRRLKDDHLCLVAGISRIQTGRLQEAGIHTMAQLALKIFESALTQRWTDKDGCEHPIGPQDILVVAPYNVQVNLLRRTLPEGARVGTVDKFQGQEAAIVIVSMTSSSEQDLPRHLEFLYSRNRLNVAVSRAMCLAVVIANPALMAIRCRTPEQMALVNTLCWLAEAGAGERPGHPALP